MAFFTKGICADNMVLLQNERNCIFGIAPSGKVVTMNFRGKQYSGTADVDGNWKIEFYADNACKGEKLTLSCEGENDIVFDGIAVGEVWLCSGQSNMQLTFDRLRFAYPEEFKLPENDNIRMITIPVTYDFSGERDMVENPVWQKVSSETLAGMSGTAYFFAKKIQAELGVPVGIINASQGGIPITAMMNAKSFEGIGNYTDRYNEVCKEDFVEKTLEENKKNGDEWNRLITEADEGLKDAWEKIEFGDICPCECTGGLNKDAESSSSTGDLGDGITPNDTGGSEENIESPNCTDSLGADAEKSNSTDSLGMDEWQDCAIPGTCDLIENAGIVWFKKEFDITEEQLEILKTHGARIWLGTIRDADTVFINGERVGITYYIYPPRRYSFDANILKVGKNTVTIRVQQNCRWGKIHFFFEKPYAITSENLKIASTVSRNVEKKEGYIEPERIPVPCSEVPGKKKRGRKKKVLSENTGIASGEASLGIAALGNGVTSKYTCTSNSVYIPLSGNWKCRVGCQVQNAPSSVFLECEPGGLYNAMLAPCFNTAIRGAVWYQGESNTLRFAEYEELLCNMIDLWRKKFVYAAKGLPFVVVQLPNWANDALPCANPVFSDWAFLRETQFEAVKKRDNTAISVLIDAGEWNDLHPEKKMTGGTRTAEQALRLVYGKNYPKPAVIKSAELSEDEKVFTVKFDSDTPLVAYKAIGEDVNFGIQTNIVEGFGVLIRRKAGKKKSRKAKPVVITEDGGYYSANGEPPIEMQGEVKMCEAVLIGNNTVEVKVPKGANVRMIREVRYLWSNCPVCVNLYAGGIPVMPGRVVL